jgi:hypothetical protein
MRQTILHALYALAILLLIPVVVMTFFRYLDWLAHMFGFAQ